MYEKVTAPFPASVWEVPCAVGDEVVAGQQLCVLEAMKMETPVATTGGGTVVAVVVQKGSLVARGQVLSVVRRK
ncbi:MAG: acetyl-CoA carboxylase biotin carboxyl carrier protein subunit [Akkermansiaceae bacterium]|nr:acetyl-CoA carboxylase biotin carboxyl carrier protein subunit [Akkermansiaceae bacterium]